MCSCFSVTHDSIITVLVQRRSNFMVTTSQSSCKLPIWLLLISCHGNKLFLPSTLAWGFEWGIYSRNVCMYMSITLWNVNLRYRLGMSIWGQAQNVNLYLSPGRIPDTCITRRRQDDISWVWRTAWLALRDVRICGAKCINKCWMQLTAGTETKKSVYHRNQ